MSLNIKVPIRLWLELELNRESVGKVLRFFLLTTEARAHIGRLHKARTTAG
jgi:hypothetical protein